MRGLLRQAHSREGIDPAGGISLCEHHHRKVDSYAR